MAKPNLFLIRMNNKRKYFIYFLQIKQDGSHIYKKPFICPFYVKILTFKNHQPLLHLINTTLHCYGFGCIGIIMFLFYPYPSLYSLMNHVYKKTCVLGCCLVLPIFSVKQTKEIGLSPLVQILIN